MITLPAGMLPDRSYPEDAVDRRRAAREALGVEPAEMVLLALGSGFATKGLDRTIDGQSPQVRWVSDARIEPSSPGPSTLEADRLTSPGAGRSASSSRHRHGPTFWLSASTATAGTLISGAGS